MIVRILGEGQWEVDAEALAELNALDDAVEQAVADNDAERLQHSLGALLDEVRSAGTELPDSDLHDSDLILPAADATLAEVRELLRGSDEGLVPN